MLKEIFIINKAGIGLFYQNFEVNGQKEKDMVSAFLKAIQDFSEEYMIYPKDKYWDIDTIIIFLALVIMGIGTILIWLFKGLW